MFEDLIPFYVQDKLIEIVSPIRRSRDKWNFRCSICGDSKKSKNKRRGNYYPRTDSYHCFNCEASAKGLWIIAKLSHMSIEDVKRDFLNSINSEKSQKEIIPTDEEEQPLVKNVINSIPNHWDDVPPNIYEAIIVKRGILDAPYTPKKWKFYYNKISKRLVIPWVSDGEMNYYQERAIYKNQDPKYIFPFNAAKSIFNLDNIDENYPYIFGLEGAFDCIWIKNGIAIGGVSLTEDQQHLLDRYLCDYVHFFDNQSKDTTAMTKSLRLAKDDIRAKIFVWPRGFDAKDVNEYVIKHKNNPFNDENFLKSRIFNGARAILELKNL
jgi:hypothetical protein